ncbi:MAG: hypothetical protein JWL90_3073 [Chthoniobacteraceae bacterium]|nr:hypothetical protein [Chthoniobacteraceae bacterium]
MKPVDKAFAGEDGCGSDGQIAFRLGALVELDAASFFEKRPLDQFGIGELIAQRPGTIGPALKQVFNDARVAPGQEPVEVAEFFVKLVVAFRTDDHDSGNRA